ncbi:glycosyltransferase [Patescibacteria group bacterium]|nr:glycosyltransferase [Patescibacteria group bacterium]
MNRAIPVSVVIPMRNAATTVLMCIESLVKQTYPIKEIIVVDNASTDNSYQLIKKYAPTAKIPVILMKRDKNRGVASSYNLGTKRAKSSLVVFMTSDTTLPSERELGKLVKTLAENPRAAAVYSTSVLPYYIWEKYNFWEKYFAARMVDNESSLMVLKFDCVRKKAFQSVGGFDEVNFGGDAMGGEDADLSNRLKTVGSILRSSARAHHVHYLAPDYRLGDMMRSRKLYARSYGRFLRKSPLLDIRASMLFLLKPFLAVLPFVPGFAAIGGAFLAVFSLVYTRKMFLTAETRGDSRIILIPLLNIFFVYFESYWILQAYLTYTSRGRD